MISAKMLYAVAFAACLCFVSVCHGGTIRQASIANPCLRDETSSNPPESISEKKLLQNSMVYMNDLRDKCHALMNAYVNGHLLTPVEAEGLATSSFTLPGLPPLRPVGNSPPEMSEEVKQDHHDLSVYLVHLQYARLQQVAYDYGRLKSEMSQTEESFYPLLCQLDTWLGLTGQRPTSYVDTSVISSLLTSDMFKDNDKKRYTRDYLLLVNLNRFLLSLSGRYVKRVESI